jgi:heme O synthase-like polyprenyltransferase
LSATFSGTSLTQQAYVEGIGSDNPDNKTAAGSSISNNSEFFLGWLTNPWYSTFGYNGIICEVIIYTSVLNSTDRTTMMNYLRKKWGLG